MRPTLRLLVLAALVPVGGCLLGLVSTQGSGDVVSLEQDFAGFTAVEAGGGCLVTIVPANEFSVVVRIDDNLQEYLDIDVSGSTLHIGLERLRRYSNLHFEVDVAMPDIDAVGLSGRTRGTIEDFTLDHSLDVRLSGGARLEGIFTASHLDISASGGHRRT